MVIKNIEDVKKVNLFGNDNYNLVMEQAELTLQNNNEVFSNRNMDITDTPISPVTLDDDYTPVLLDADVMKEYKKMIKLINNPETAKEYSYVLLGKLASLGDEACYLVDKIIGCNLDEGMLDSRETHIDNKKLTEIIAYAIYKGYNFISLGHTHPLISEEEKQVTIANYLSEEIKQREFIREAGLNLSLQDFVSYETLYQYFVSYPNIRTSETVIMHNGEMVMFSKQNGQLKRFTVIMDRTTGDPIYVSSKDEINKRNQ